MHYAVVFVLLLSFVFGLGLLARRLNVPYPILFVIGGLLISLVPRLPQLKLDPDFIFFIFLPPLLYIQAFFTSWRDFRQEIRPIVMLAIGLVIATTVTVAFLSHWLIPNFPLAAGFVLGAIISPPDAIAASAIANRLGLSRQVVTILEGESLINDSTSLVIFKISLAAMLMPGSVLHGNAWLPGMFVYVSAGGIAVGLAVGWIVGWLRKKIIDDGPHIYLTISLLTPYVSYLAGEAVDVSAVLAVVTTGLYLGWDSPEVLTSGVRLQTQAVWELIIYLLNGIIFVLIGLQLPGIIAGIEHDAWWHLLLYALMINAICIIVRLGWVLPGAYAPFLIFPAIRRTEKRPDIREVFIVAWSGMRGVVSLAAALSLGIYAHAHLIQFLAFSVILVTLVFQGLTLPPLIRYLGVGDSDNEARMELDARRRLSDIAFEKIAEIKREKKFPKPAIEAVEHSYQERTLAYQDALVEQIGWSEQRHYLLSARRLRHMLIATQRRALITMYRTGVVDHEILHKIEHELDLEEIRLKG